ncbi:hypothetical protein ACSLBF_04965 [Pseudoalteromonas sp. T1lg65]|uniref:hypothetical protein n=1 Tax=Pseudoalteromonas sp. T1lg65 TaxID=2077101 RepID=UPI003F7A8770
MITGRFTIPEGVFPAGEKTVLFSGSGGTEGTATYTGSGQIRTETLTRVTTITTQRWDPLAQTFTLTESRFIAAVELFFTAIGDKPAQVQIREVEQGVPTQTILAQSRVASSDISSTGATRFSFTPVFLQAGQEYAIVVLTNDAEHAVAIAELGQYDQQQGWVTSQPYQVGVLLSSSNASTWTPHQQKDLTFNLLAAKFSDTTRQVELGEVDVDDVTDLMALAVVQRPSAETDIDFTLSDTESAFALHHVPEWTPQQLDGDSIKGKVKVTANLSGSESLSPVLFAGTQCATGKVQPQAQYISRAFTCNHGGRVTVSFEAVLGGLAKVKVYLQQNDDSWLEVPNAVSPSPSQRGLGWQQYDYVQNAYVGTLTRVKLVLSGTGTHRPRIRNLRAFST